MNYLLILVGFFALIYGANLMVNGASALAKNLNIPNIVIGLTIVAFGTSAPELVVNIFSSLKQNSDMTFANIMGSNIFNIAIIIGICAIITPIAVKRNTHWLEIPFNLLAVAAVLVLIADAYFSNNTANSISKSDGIILLLFFIIFLVYNIQLAFTGKEKETIEVATIKSSKALMFFVLGLIGLIVGGNFITNGATGIATALGISDRIIGLTILAIGTSLPELATSVAAIKKGNTDLAIGNVVGSNLFNIFFILGISAIINPISISEKSFIDVYFLLFITILLYLFVIIGKGKKISRIEGGIFICLFICYTIYLILNE